MKHVLVVDDDDEIRGLVGMTLEEDGYVVDEAASAEDAFDLFTENRYEIVITDIKMKSMSGLDLLQKIKAVRSECLVVIMTGYSTKGNAISALKAGAVDYIEKPIRDFDVVRGVMKRIEASYRDTLNNNQRLEELENEYRKLEILKGHIAEVAVTDTLTGLYNRRYLENDFEKSVNQALRYNRELSVAFFDLDNFKPFNDTFGHQRGDRLLCEIGRVVQKNLRMSDTLVRYGGDEFVIIMPETNEKAAYIVAEKIRGLVQQINFGEENEKTSITLSIGIAAIEKKMSSHDLIGKADMALYVSKAKGRNRTTSASTLEAPETKGPLKNNHRFSTQSPPAYDVVKT